MGLPRAASAARQRTPLPEKPGKAGRPRPVRTRQGVQAAAPRDRRRGPAAKAPRYSALRQRTVCPARYSVGVTPSCFLKAVMK